MFGSGTTDQAVDGHVKHAHAKQAQAGWKLVYVMAV